MYNHGLFFPFYSELLYSIHEIHIDKIIPLYTLILCISYHWILMHSICQWSRNIWSVAGRNENNTQPVGQRQESESDMLWKMFWLLPENSCIPMPIFITQLMLCTNIQGITFYLFYINAIIILCPESPISLLQIFLLSVSFLSHELGIFFIFLSYYNFSNIFRKIFW